jgi:hypothetical protein
LQETGYPETRQRQATKSDLEGSNMPTRRLRWKRYKAQQKTIQRRRQKNQALTKDTKHRDMMRMYRKARKLAYEIRGPWKKPEKPKKEAKRVYRAYITLEDLVSVHHLEHRVGKREEFQTNLARPHEFRKALIRVFRLKNLRWSLYHVEKDGNRARMPQLYQVIDDEAEYVLVIEEQKRKRPNSPGTSKRQHFERANQKRRRKDFEWYAPPDKSPPKKLQKREEHQEERDPGRFTWIAPDTKPHVEPPRAEGWKPLDLALRPAEIKVRELAEQRMEEWSKDQEEYTERQFQEVQKRKQEHKEPRAKVAVDPGPPAPAEAIRSSVCLTKPRKILGTFLDPDEAETKKYLDGRNEEERQRHERKAERERAEQEKVRRELETNPLPEETENERKSRRDGEWLSVRFQLSGEREDKIKWLRWKIGELQRAPDGIIDEAGIIQIKEEIKKVGRHYDMMMQDQEKEFRKRWEREDKAMKK